MQINGTFREGGCIVVVFKISFDKQTQKAALWLLIEKLLVDKDYWSTRQIDRQDKKKFRIKVKIPGLAVPNSGKFRFGRFEFREIPV